MALFEWKDGFCTKVTDMDEQHKVIFHFINVLHEESRKEKQKDVAGMVLDELEAYVQRHFSAEEELLWCNQYPHLEEQRRQHAFFLSQLRQLRSEYRQGVRSISASILQFLKDWFLTHILHEDKKYGDYLSVGMGQPGIKAHLVC